MTVSEFNSIAEDIIGRTHDTLVRKQGEYNLEDDRLGVFKRAGDIQQATASQALLGMLTKHIVSIYDHVVKNIPMTESMAAEKIGDTINYCVLLYAVLKEEGFKGE